MFTDELNVRIRAETVTIYSQEPLQYVVTGTASVQYSRCTVLSDCTIVQFSPLFSYHNWQRTTHRLTFWLPTYISHLPDQSAAVQVLRNRARMISCEGWQRVWRLAWHWLALCHQRLFSRAKASVAEITAPREHEIVATGRRKPAERCRHNRKTNRGPRGNLSINAVSWTG